MIWKVYKSPKKEGDMPLRIFTFEPNDFLVAEISKNNGPIIIEEEKEVKE